MIPANKSQFNFSVQNLPHSFQVIRFEGWEKLSEGFQFTITLSSEENNFEYSDLVGQQAKLECMLETGEKVYHGMIESFEQIPGRQGKSSWVITLVPRLFQLNYSQSNRIFQNKSVMDIVESVLKGAGLPEASYHFNLHNVYPIKEFTVQYNESDFNFICRLLESVGVYFTFKYSDTSEILVFCDSSVSSAYLPLCSTLPYLPKDGLSRSEIYSVNDFRKKSSLITGKVRYQDYNYNLPDSKIMGQSKNEGIGEHQEYSANLKSAAEATQLSVKRSELNKSLQTKITGQSDCPALMMGYKLTVKDGADSGMAGECFLTSLQHHGDQEAAIFGGGEDPYYKNTFSAIPVNVIYRPPLQAKKPSVPGVMSVKVDGSGGDYAYLDDEGRYKVKMPFDQSSLKEGGASLPIRMSQPYAGDNYGMHFPIHTGSELMVGFEDGDLDRPIGLGAAPNPQTSSPVTNRNPSQSVIRTESGNELVMEDLKEESFITLKTAGQHQISLTDKREEQKVELKSSKGNVFRLDDTEAQIYIQTSEQTNSILLDDKNEKLILNTKYGHQVMMDDKNKCLSLKSGKGHHIEVNDQKETISISDSEGKNTLEINISSNKIILKSGGDMVLKAKKNFNVEAENINLMSKKGNININGKKGVNIKGQELMAKAGGNLKIKSGLDTKVDAGKNLNLSSKMNTESKAGVAHNTSGVMVKAEAKGIHTVKGAMVKIN